MSKSYCSSVICVFFSGYFEDLYHDSAILEYASICVSVYIAWSPLSFLGPWVYIFNKFGKYSYFLKIFFSRVNLSSTSGSLITNLLNCFILPHKSLKDMFTVHFCVSFFYPWVLWFAWFPSQCLQIH